MYTKTIRSGRRTLGEFIIFDETPDASLMKPLVFKRAICICNQQIIDDVKLFVNPILDNFSIMYDWDCDEDNVFTDDNSDVLYVICGDYNAINRIEPILFHHNSKPNVILVPTTLDAQINCCNTDRFQSTVWLNCNTFGILLNVSFLKREDIQDYYRQFAYAFQIALAGDVILFSWMIQNMYELQERDSDTLKEFMSMVVAAYQKSHKKAKDSAIDDSMFASFITDVFQSNSDLQLPREACLALGCIATAFISYKKNLLAMEEYYEIRDMFVPFGLPISFSGIDCITILKQTVFPQSGTIQMPLLVKIGKLVLCDVSSEEVLLGLEELYYDENENE